MTGYNVIPSELAQQATKYDEVAKTVADLHKALTDQMSALGACWGDDAAGAAFAAKYTPAATSVVTQLSNAVTGLHDLAATVHDWQAQYTQADQALMSQAKGLTL